MRLVLIDGGIAMTKMKCPECNGSGEVPCDLAFATEKHPVHCPVYQGDPDVRIDCQLCEGEGSVDI